MKECRDNIRRQAAGSAAIPTTSMLFLALAIIDVSMEAARERVRMNEVEWISISTCIYRACRALPASVRQFDLDAPLPELTTNGHQSSLAKWIGKTPHSIVKTYGRKGVSTSPERPTV